jgi:type I restriction enzyme, S subunit
MIKNTQAQWSENRIGDLPIKIIDGDRSAKYPKTSEYVNMGVPFLNTTNIENHTLRLEDVNYITEEKFNSITKGQVKKNDIVITTRGSVGDAALFDHKIHDRALINAQMLILRADNKIINQGYLFNYIRSYWFRAYASNFSTGSAQPQLPIRDLKFIPIKYPDITSQEMIASVLLNVDRLIEINKQKIGNLEQLAQLLYREWFVEFRFPGYEKCKFVNSELGKIPERWDVQRIGDSFTVVLGGTPSRANEEYWKDGTVPWINSGEVNNLRIIRASELITELALDRSSAKLMPKRTTLLAITGATLGQVSLTEIELCANQSVIGICDKSQLYSEFIYLSMMHNIKEIILAAGGGAQQHINKDIVCDYQIVFPDDIIQNFKIVIEPIFNLIGSLITKNDCLVSMRDLLLPKLMSGEIDVSKLDIEIEAKQKTETPDTSLLPVLPLDNETKPYAGL